MTKIEELGGIGDKTLVGDYVSNEETNLGKNNDNYRTSTDEERARTKKKLDNALERIGRKKELSEDLW